MRPIESRGTAMDVASFDEIRDRFVAITERIVWCTVCTVDRKGRPRSRILHPIWDGTTGWIATGRHTLKAKHIAANPYVTLCYWDPDHEQVMADCRAEWQDDDDSKAWLWNELKSRPEPVGYDPTIFWDAPSDPNFGALRLDPWRIEVWSLADMSQGRPPRVFRPARDG